MSDFIFRISPNIILGSYTVSRLGQLAKEWGQRFMLIIDPILKESGTQEKITKPLEDHGLTFFTFDEISTVADSQTAEKALKLARDSHAQCIIAAGGSKTLNLGRAVSALFYETDSIYSVLDGKKCAEKPLPLICVPTTIRDPFMFTDSTPVTDSRSSRLKIIKSQNGLCRLILWDPNLTVTLTDKQNSAMYIETLCLALEAYISQKSSFFSDMLAEKSLQLLGWAKNGAPTLTVTTPPEILLAQGGCMASLGAGCSSLGAATLLAQSINARYKISSSLTASILIPYVIEDGAKFRAEKLARAARITGAAQEDSPDEEAVKALQEYVRQELAKANLPARLKDLNVTVEKLSLAAEDAGETELINSLARSMTSDDLFELIKQAF